VIVNIVGGHRYQISDKLHGQGMTRKGVSHPSLLRYNLLIYSATHVCTSSHFLRGVRTSISSPILVTPEAWTAMEDLTEGADHDVFCATVYRSTTYTTRRENHNATHLPFPSNLAAPSDELSSLLSR
jgi:hypothetical protein